WRRTSRRWSGSCRSRRCWTSCGPSGRRLRASGRRSMRTGSTSSTSCSGRLWPRGLRCCTAKRGTASWCAAMCACWPNARSAPPTRPCPTRCGCTAATSSSTSSSARRRPPATSPLRACSRPCAASRPARPQSPFAPAPSVCCPIPACCSGPSPGARIPVD
ncbi:hypothetical protein NEOLI_005395, partial [Neolecta irregularis DAH-3]